MIVCGCGERFKTQAGLNEHRRLKHDKWPTTEPLPVAPKKKRSEWTPEMRASRAAIARAQWQGPRREAQAAAVREGQRKRRERERLEKAAVKIEILSVPIELSLPQPEPPAVPVVAFPDAYGALLRQRLAEAVTALVAFEVQRALETHRAPGPEPKAPEPASVVVPVDEPKPERTVPLPRGDWAAARSMRTNRIEPVERPPLPLPLPTEVETVDEPDDPENVHRNLGMRAAIAIAHRLGVRVRKNSAGEIEFAHPLYFRRMRVNAARHTAPRVLLTMLREVEKSIKLGRPSRSGPSG